ncbi:uncharacterized protein LOC144591871 [Rhinoraja longicauda]
MPGGANPRPSVAPARHQSPTLRRPPRGLSGHPLMGETAAQPEPGPPSLVGPHDVLTLPRQQLVQQPHDMGRGWQEPVTKRHHADELLQATYRGWTGKPADGVDFVRQGNRALRSHSVAEKVNRGHAKAALGEVDSQPVLAEQLKELPEVGTVLLPRAAGYQDVVEVDEQEIQPATNAVH